jgi:multisubunit Na+/H+ antiporter MnhE subunit
MIKLFCGILVVAIVACGIVNANEPVGIEVRKRNAIGRLGLVSVQVAVKAEADGTAIVSFQAPEPGTYILNYTSGLARGKVAAIVKVEKAGPVTTKVTPTRR